MNCWVPLLVNLSFCRLDRSPNVNLELLPFQFLYCCFREIYFIGRWGKTVFLIPFLSEPGVNQIIGITSLCLYNSALFSVLQDGMMHKNRGSKLWKREKKPLQRKRELTLHSVCDMLIMLGGKNGGPFFEQKTGVSMCTGTCLCSP